MRCEASAIEGAGRIVCSIGEEELLVLVLVCFFSFSFSSDGVAATSGQRPIGAH